MKERERLVVTGLVMLMLLLWFGFAVHRSPRFAGSLLGGLLGVTGALLMLVPLAYSIIKRVPRLKTAFTRRVPMRTVLAWHIYAGVAGPILGLLHTGHKFESTLGILLTAMMLIVVLSGFTGRYLMSRISQEIREKQSILTGLEVAYSETAAELASRPQEAALAARSGFLARIAAGLFVPATAPNFAAPYRAIRLAESIADVEYAISTHETFKGLFSRWLKFHIVISYVLYILLGLHIWSGIHFGLRWFA
jgi:hypothetical protein